MNKVERAPATTVPTPPVAVFATAEGSAAEVAAALDLAAAIGALDPAVAAEGQALAVRLKMLLRRLR